jgi:hypothetical protein
MQIFRTRSEGDEPSLAWLYNTIDPAGSMGTDMIQFTLSVHPFKFFQLSSPWKVLMITFTDFEQHDARESMCEDT